MSKSGLRPRLEPLEDRCLFTASIAYGQIPLTFEVNQGQTDSQVDFLAHGPGYCLFLTPSQAVLNLQKVAGLEAGSVSGSPVITSTVLDMELVGANASAPAMGLDPLAAVSNYFIGNDPSQWHVNIPNFGRVEYENIYAGVNLIYYGNQRQLEYDFVVTPGANPGVIKLAFLGADSLSLDGQGNLVLHTEGGDVLEHAPILYQDINGVRQAVFGQFILLGNGQIGFDVGAYDKSRPLVIDPVLGYSTFLGGSGDDQGLGIAVDSSGNAYLTGWTASTDFPTVNPLQGTNKAAPLASNVFVAKLNAAGTALVYSTYLGGTGTSAGDEGLGIAVDSSGDAYVTGFTFSTNFPTAGSPVQLHYGGGGDAFVAKLNATGSSLVYSTYLGGASQDEAFAIAVDSSGNAYVTGYTWSTNFPTANPFQSTNHTPTQTAFVAKLNAGGSSLVYSTYLGGTRAEAGAGIAVDSSGSAYVTGVTYSTDFPITNGAVQTTFGGGTDAFVTKFTPSGSGLVYSTYLGGNSFDEGNAIAVDSAGNAYITGDTRSTNFPTVNAFQSSFGGGSSTGDAFITKLNAAGSAFVYSTYLGGSGDDKGTAIALDSSGNAYVTGFTKSTNFPTANAIQAANAGGAHDAFVAKLSATGSALSYSTYLGGSGDDQATGIAVDGSGNAYVIGYTTSTNFPTAQALQSSFGGGTYDAFVAKIDPPAGSSMHFVITALSTTIAGTALSMTVTAEDSNNHTVTSYTGTVHFTSSDAQAVLPADYTFVAADAGVHAFTVTLKTAGNQWVTATDKVTSTITGSTNGITISPAPASSFVLSGFPSPTTAGVVGTARVTAKDSFGNTASGYNGTVHFTSSDSQAVLPANYTFATTDAGVHSFSLTLKTSGTQAITVTDTVTTTLTGSEAGITVKPAAAGHLRVGAPTNSTAGTAFSITVTAMDPYGNIATGYTGTVHFTSSDKKALLPANYAFTGADGGVHVFSNGVTLKTAGSQTVTATDTVAASVTGKSSAISVSAAALNHLKITAPTSSTAGLTFTITVTAQDAYNNTITNYTGTVHFTSTDSRAILPANYTFTSTDKGVHTFSNGVTLKTAGARNVSATDTVTASITGKASVTVSAAALDHLKVTAPTTSTAGAAFTITVTAQDAYNNTVTNYTDTIHFTSTDSRAILPANYTFTSTDKGVHTFSNGVTLKTAGAQMVTATDTVTATVTGSASIKVTAGQASTLSINAPINVTHGIAFTFTVTALDAYGNVATSYRGTVHFSSSDPLATLPVNYTFTSTNAGVHTFSAILNSTGSQSLTATDTVTPSNTGTESGIQVAAASLTDLLETETDSPEEIRERLELWQLENIAEMLVAIQTAPPGLVTSPAPAQASEDWMAKNAHSETTRPWLAMIVGLCVPRPQSGVRRQRRASTTP